MHLTGGQFKGRIVPLPKSENIIVKPTLSKVRESVFNMLFSHFGDFSNLSFLDMFAGSGIMALEASSRNFKEVYAIELDPKIYFALQKSFKNFNKNISFIKGDCLKIIHKLPEFDVIYIDPPWNFEYSSIIECAFKKLNKEGIIIVEYDKKKSKPPYLYKSKEILPFKEKIYGRCVIDFLKV